MSNSMDNNKFDILYQKIPKDPEVWMLEDVQKWLEHIGMDKYFANFEEMGVDGYLILDLTEDDIEVELKIKTKLHRRKIIKAINVLKKYREYMKNL